MHISRFGKLQYHAQNGREATLDIGYEPGQWSPGELLQIALVGCNALSAEKRISDVLGGDFKMTAGIDSEFNKEENRFTGFTVELVPEVTGTSLSDEELEALKKRTNAAIERYCTISRTISHAAPNETVITVEQ